MSIPAYVVRWLDDPDGGGTFIHQRDLIRAHPPECASLAHPWLPRKGGVSCLSDSMTCESCGIVFFWEGLTQAFEDCPYTNHWICGCCSARCGCTE